MLKEALFYEKLANSEVKCRLCPHKCIITIDNTGRCGVRKNIDGNLYATSYAKIVSANVDPIEKKPLYHFMPATDILSLGSYGCNMTCNFCQNHEISQNILDVNTFDYNKAIEHAISNNIPSIAYTYNEPTVWFEYMLDCAKAAKEHGLKNIIVTNGLIEQEPLKELLKYTDAVNIDLKAFDSEQYKALSGNLDTIKNNIELCHKHCHVEVTTLLVTDFNCDEALFLQLVEFIANIDKNIPLHISRFFPAYKNEALPTDARTLELFYNIAKSKLNYCYIGNYNSTYSNTHCPHCDNILITRDGYNINITSDLTRCDKCSQDISITH